MPPFDAEPVIDEPVEDELEVDELALGAAGDVLVPLGADMLGVLGISGRGALGGALFML